MSASAQPPQERGWRARIVDFLAVAVPKVAGGALMVLLNLVLIGVLEPASLATFTLSVTSIVMIDAIFGTAVDMAVLRLVPTSRTSAPGRSAALEVAGLCAKLSIGALLALIVLAFGDRLSDLLFHRPHLTGLVWLTAGGATGLLLLRSALVRTQIAGDFERYGRLEWLHVIVKFGLAGVAIATGSAEASLLLGAFALAPFVAFAAGVRFAWPAWRRADPAPWKAVAALAAFAKWYVLTVAVGTIVSRIDLFVLARSAGLADAGIYAAAMAIAMIPELLGTYLGVLMYPRIMPLCAQRRFAPFFRRAQTLLFLAGIVGMVVAALFLEPMLQAMFPARFAAAAPVALILVAGALAGMIAYPVLVPFLMFQRPRFMLALDGTLVVPLLYVYAAAIQAHGALGAAWVTAAARITRTIVAQLFAQRIARSM